MASSSGSCHLELVGAQDGTHVDSRQHPLHPRLERMFDSWERLVVCSGRERSVFSGARRPGFARAGANGWPAARLNCELPPLGSPFAHRVIYWCSRGCRCRHTRTWRTRERSGRRPSHVTVVAKAAGVHGRARGVALRYRYPPGSAQSPTHALGRPKGAMVGSPPRSKCGPSHYKHHPDARGYRSRMSYG